MPQPAESKENAATAVKVRFDELLPHEFRKRLAQRPIAYLPLGTLEWHGEHLPLGSDAMQSEGLMVECARRFGGIVMPPIHLGPDRAKPADDGKMLVGMDYAESTTPPRQLDGSCYWVPNGFHLLMVDAILAQLKRAGFRAVFADGHGPSRWSWVENLSEREARFGLKLFGVTKEDRRAVEEPGGSRRPQRDLADDAPEAEPGGPVPVAASRAPRGRKGSPARTRATPRPRTARNVLPNPWSLSDRCLPKRACFDARLRNFLSCFL